MRAVGVALRPSYVQTLQLGESYCQPTVAGSQGSLNEVKAQLEQCQTEGGQKQTSIDELSGQARGIRNHTKKIESYTFILAL